MPGLDTKWVREILNSTEIPFKGRLELAPGLSISMKPMGNWRRTYRDEETERGYCPLVGKEFGILSNGNVVFCHIDYDGKTAYANARDGELRSILQNSSTEIAEFQKEGIVPKGCHYCSVPHKYPEQPVP